MTQHAQEEILDCSLDDFIEFLFTKPPLPPHQVVFDWEQILAGAEDPLMELFQGLLEIYTKGMARLFGDENGRVNLDSLRDEDSMLIEQYFQSIGFTIYFQKTNIENRDIKTGRWPPPPPQPHQTGERLCTRVMTIPTSLNIYEIAFDVAPLPSS